MRQNFLNKCSFKQAYCNEKKNLLLITTELNKACIKCKWWKVVRKQINITQKTKLLTSQRKKNVVKDWHIHVHVPTANDTCRFSSNHDNETTGRWSSFWSAESRNVKLFYSLPSCQRLSQLHCLFIAPLSCLQLRTACQYGHLITSKSP